MSMILLVEDNPHIMKINAEALSMYGYEILQATTAGECREAMRWHPVDLVVLDIMLPDGDGVELCRELKGRYHIPILFLTALGENREVVEGLRAGGDDYLVKPFAFARFRQAMDKFLQTQNLLSCPQESSLLDQQAIDRLIRRQERPEPGGNQMSKGLNAATLERVRSFLSASRGQALTSEEIAEQVHLSRITIRRYVNYMVETGELASSIDYQTGGRPSIRYSYTGEASEP